MKNEPVVFGLCSNISPSDTLEPRACWVSSTKRQQSGTAAIYKGFFFMPLVDFIKDKWIQKEKRIKIKMKKSLFYS